ncbi:MAG: HDOD domain-containing protein [Pseudomonadales bacterium]
MAQPLSTIDPDAMLRAEIEHHSLHLPPLPGVAAQVLAINVDGNDGASELAKLIQQDQSLASNVMRIVNSPSFRGATEIVALQQAIARLGMSRIREMALSVSLKAVLDQKGPYDVLVQAAWQRALGSALWAREVARMCRKNVENAYLGALLHNIGAPVVLHRLSALEDADAVSGCVADELAQRHLQRAGLMLIESWHLPALLARYVEVQGDFDAAAADGDLVACVAAGVAIAQCVEQETLSLESIVELPAISFLNLYPDDAQTLLDMRDSVAQLMTEMNG